MNRTFKRRPDYSALYPGVDISSEVLSVLKRSDRRMEYHEYDLKYDKWKIDLDAQSVQYFPSREDSYERLIGEHNQFKQNDESVEDAVVKSELIAAMLECLELLGEDDRYLLRAIYFDGASQRDLARTFRISQPAIKKRRDAALKKLRRYMKF